jgi:hypothetical protein
VRTGHPAGHWHVIAGDDMRTARGTVVRTVCDLYQSVKVRETKARDVHEG